MVVSDPILQPEWRISTARIIGEQNPCQYTPRVMEGTFTNPIELQAQ